MSQNFNYCTKDGDFINWGSVKYNPPYTIDIELLPWQIQIRDICLGEPDDRYMYWYWEKRGCGGKTTFQKWLFLNLEGVVVLCGESSGYEEWYSRV